MSQKPAEVDYQLSRASGELLREFIGGVQGNPELGALLHALHQVVAGGRVQVRVAQPGDAAGVARLDALLAEGLRQNNRVNAAAGAYVMAA